jgi:molybdopterin molybdotransferase
MVTVDAAREAVLERARSLPPEECPLQEALDAVLDHDVAADGDSPPFDKALVDGFAVRSSDLGGGNRRLKVGEVIVAGQVPSRPLGVGETAVVMTGAPLPPGADAVVMQERTRTMGGEVLIEEAGVRPGQNLLRRGGEMRAGEVVLTRGSILSPARLGLLASLGKSRVRVTRQPRVVIVPTGNELVDPTERPGPGQIRNSNSVMLEALTRQERARVASRAIVGDDLPELCAALARELESDLLVITGGVSAGQRDLVPRALDELGVECVFHKVRVKPGKPVWFGVALARGEGPGALVFGLPGNPVSSLVAFLLFVRPALAALAGKAAAVPRTMSAQLARPFVHRGDRPTYHPAILTGCASTAPGLPLVATLDWAGSADLRTAALAEGFAVFPPGDREYAAGTVVLFLPMR